MRGKVLSRSIPPPLRQREREKKERERDSMILFKCLMPKSILYIETMVKLFDSRIFCLCSQALLQSRVAGTTLDPETSGGPEEDSAKKGPRIRLRTEDITTHPRRKGRTRSSPVAGGQTPRHRPRLIIAPVTKGLEEAVSPPSSCLLKS